MAKVSIIIPVWNLWDMTLQCLESIVSSTAQEILAKDIEVIVVDNGSSDETAQALTPTLTRLFAHHAKAIKLPENLGFAKACNMGARAASSPLLFFLNNDTILTQGWLYPLLQSLENNPQFGMVGPLLLYPNDTVQHCGVCITPTSKLVHLYESFPVSHPVVNKQRIMQVITGAALLIRAKLFRECGEFHEGYVNGFEDIDLCASVRQKGFQCACIPKSRIYHLTSQTPGRFANDEQNGKVLKQRGISFVPDQHIIAAKDGFTPLLNSALILYLSLPEAKEKALNMAFAQNFDAQRCKARLLAEPLWYGGYELLARHYEEQGQWSEALNALIELTNLNPAPKYFAPLQNLAKRMGDVNVLEQALRMEQSIHEALAKPELLQQKATHLQDWATQTNDGVLLGMLRQWFLENTEKG